MNVTLTHIALHVKDIDACIAFYQDYTGMQIVRDRKTHDSHVYWLAEPGKETKFIMVIMPAGPGRNQPEKDLSHFGFAVSSHADVDSIAKRAADDGILVWAPRQESYPVGYYCGVRDPDGNFVEFSYGQPLGPGAKE
jgi:catechol 2,3-dioxygenase-like lactoylglutathione lyase family enzyme